MPIKKTRKISKSMAKLIQKADREIEQECSLQLDIVTCSCIIALNRYWGWKQEKLSDLLSYQQKVWDECGADNNMSMIKLLDEECDIELTNHEGVSYRDVIYLNADIDEGKPLTDMQWVAMRQNQKKWVTAQITACMCLALHRKEGWGFKRLSELMVKMDDVKYEFGYDPKRLCKAALEEAKYDWLGINNEKAVG